NRVSFALRERSRTPMVAEAQNEAQTDERGHAVADELLADPIVRREPMIRRDPYLNDPPGRRNSQIRRAPNSAGIYDVLDLILDKGIVIDAFVRVSLVGIELLTVDLRVVIASVDTYLRWAEAVHRLVLENRPRELPDMVSGGRGLAGKAKKALGVGDGSKEEEEEEEAQEEARERRKGGKRGFLSKLT